MIIYTAKQGDNLGDIARRFSVSLRELENINGIFGDILMPGTSIVVPTENTAHVVNKGDSLYSIALSSGTTVEELLKLNPNLRFPYTIYPGEYIITPPEKKLGEIEVNGYCYPTIRPEVLKGWLPSLTYLSIFSHRLNPDGSLEGISDDALIATAKESNTAPLCVVTNTNQNGGFDSDTAEQFLTNSEAVERFLNEISDFLKRKGYLGINMDLEYIPPSVREAYNEFLARLSERLGAEGLIFTTAIAPKQSDTQVGTLYEAHDYATHGKYADRIIIMTYEWGYIAGPPLAVAPLNEVEKVLRYAVSRIPSEKILMGMPNYGYDWTLPYREGTFARPVTSNSALNLAIMNRSEIGYNPSSDAPNFTYRDSKGDEHIVWFDDARSYEARLKLISALDLGGASFWTINNLYSAGLYVLNSLYTVKKLL